ncbi:MAG: YfiR family protein [Bacteroidota bacterium]
MRIFLFVFLFIISQLTYAQDYKFHSVFIYNFTRYIEWPDSYKVDDFVIGVLGKTQLMDQLDVMAKTRTVGNQKISIKRFNKPSDIGKCHMLFVPADKSSELEAIKESLNNSPTLIITEQEGLGSEGSGINFIQVDGRWKFELNESAVVDHNLKVSSELKKLAILI